MSSANLSAGNTAFEVFCGRIQSGRSWWPAEPAATAAWARALRSRLDNQRERVFEALKGYTTAPYVDDELRRSDFLLAALADDPSLFGGKVLTGAVFLPRNQLLYSFVSMALVPAQFTRKLFARPPLAAYPRISALAEILQVEKLSPQIQLRKCNYGDFIKECAYDADFVVFAGSGDTARRVTSALSGNELFIGNGSGHNPIVVCRDADLADVARRTVRLCLYNQGQDCSAPSAILCPEDTLPSLVEHLRRCLTAIRLEDALKPEWERNVGPNTDREHVLEVQESFAELASWIVEGGTVEPNTGWIEPTIIVYPLSRGPLYREWFAPVIPIQPYGNDQQLLGYFATPDYERNAMYVTTLGDGAMSPPLAHPLHPDDTILVNTDLHEFERGDRPYGGYGAYASFYSIGGKHFPSPILIQRDLWRYMLAPRRASDAARPARSAGKVGDVRREKRSKAALCVHPLATSRASRLAKLNDLKSRGYDPYPSRCRRSHSNKALQAAFNDLPPDAVSNARAEISGRIRAIRNSGMFMDVYDGTDKLQLHVDLKSASSQTCDMIEMIDIGDFVSASGRLRRTRRGELTLEVDEIAIIAKALLPSQTHCRVADAEVRHSKRYLALIENQRSRKILLTRFKLIAAARAYLSSQGFLEVETPMLQPVDGGAAAKPFRTTYTGLRADLFLRTASELYLRRLLVGGLSDRLFELSRNFRNESITGTCQPEFTALEVHQAYTDYLGMRDLLESIVRTSIREATGGIRAIVDRTEVEFEQPFAEINLVDEVGCALGEDFRAENDVERLRKQVEGKLDREIAPDATWGQLAKLVFEAVVQPRLITPTHVIGLPTEISPLAKRTKSDPRMVEGCKTYCLGMEIGNAFSEMNDPIEQRIILEKHLEMVRLSGDFDKTVDVDFHEALEYGMPPSGQLRVGIDRLAMLATGVNRIQDVIAFPATHEFGEHEKLCA